MTIPIVQGVAVDPPGSNNSNNNNNNQNSGGGFAQALNQPADGGGAYHQAPQQQQQQQHYQTATATPLIPNSDDDPDKFYSHAELQQIRESQQQGLSRQPYQDVAWAVFFYIHLIIVVGLGLWIITSNGGGGEGGGGGSTAGSLGGVFVIAGVSGATAIGLSACALSFMMRNTEQLVQMALIFSVASSLAVGVLGFVMGNWLMGIMGIVSFGIGICYAYFVWSRIPFAAINLKTALTAVKANMGLTAVALGFSVLGFAWSLLWFMGVGSALSQNSLFVVFLMFLSYYWTHQVLSNTVHVTSVGVVGTWWFVPLEANAWWAPALTASFVRATTTSFGSICFGSFLVAFVQALRSLEYYTRDDDNLRVVSCIIQCILSCIEGIIEYLNRWAYTYVGLYGFSYITAGRNVFQLFQNKGWTVIITDDLADNVLFMVSVGIGMASGLIGMFMGLANPNFLDGLGLQEAGVGVVGPAFLIAFLVGLLLSSIFMSVVNSAVNTVIVCYAEAPGEFQMNHPELSAEMRSAWTSAWPGIYN